MSLRFAQFCRAIPRSDESAKALVEFSDGDSATLQGYVDCLHLLGAIHIDSVGSIRASSQTAKYLLESLANYAEADLKLIADWDTRGIQRNGDILHNGASFLYALESQRIHQQKTPKPSRVESVAQVLIVRKNPQSARVELLFQFDANANQYQLIGGRRKDHETDLEMTIKREIEEELVDALQWGRDYQLRLIAADMILPATISPTFGALTEYHFAIYHMLDLQKDVTLSPDDLWVPVEEVLNGYVTHPDGRQFTFNDHTLYRLMDETLMGGLSQLPSSFRKDQP